MTSAVTILLLDGEPILRRATALMLSNRGGHVSAVATADEAVALLERQAFDVAIVDLSGPHAARELLGRVRSTGHPPGRVIAISPTPLEGHEVGEHTELLFKPYPFDLLLTAVFGAPDRLRASPFARLGAPRRRAARPRPELGLSWQTRGGRARRDRG